VGKAPAERCNGGVGFIAVAVAAKSGDVSNRAERNPNEAVTFDASVSAERILRRPGNVDPFAQAPRAVKKVIVNKATDCVRENSVWKKSA
jgi:hypothetical protein